MWGGKLIVMLQLCLIWWYCIDFVSKSLILQFSKCHKCGLILMNTSTSEILVKITLILISFLSHDYRHIYPFLERFLGRTWNLTLTLQKWFSLGENIKRSTLESHTLKPSTEKIILRAVIFLGGFYSAWALNSGFYGI